MLLAASAFSRFCCTRAAGCRTAGRVWRAECRTSDAAALEVRDMVVGRWKECGSGAQWLLTGKGEVNDDGEEAGSKLGLSQSEGSLSQHALTPRVYAEGKPQEAYHHQQSPFCLLLPLSFGVIAQTWLLTGRPLWIRYHNNDDRQSIHYLEPAAF
jgi:hypothetical protein